MNKITAQKILNEIGCAQNILVHLHPGPDGDSIGSALSFYHAGTQLGKKVTVISGDSELPVSFSSIPGFSQIVKKNFCQTDLSKYDLFVILDSSSLTQISKISPVIFPENLKTVVIDHHDTNEKFADINLVDKESPATCQTLYELYKFWNIKIDKNIALCLMLGIYTDTGGFKYPRTTTKTFSIASGLSKINPKYTDLIFDIENNEDPDRLKMLSILLSSVENYFGNKVSIACLPYDIIKEKQLNPQTSENLNIANMLKSVNGRYIGISMVEYQPCSVKVSFRTRDPQKYDVSKLALATGFGGGHKAAAGATIPNSLSESKKILFDILKSTYPELGNP